MKTIDCKKHGLQKAIGVKSKLRCSVCAVEAVNRRRKKVKKMAVEYKGGKCIRCGYRKSMAALDFHHRDPKEKDFQISRNGHCTAWEKLKVELDKCDLVYRNCHAEIHEELDAD